MLLRKSDQPGKDEVLVRVRATGLNHADILQAQGKYNPPPGLFESDELDEASLPFLKGASDVLGLEICGTIVKVRKKEERKKEQG